MYSLQVERRAQKKLAKISEPYYSKIKSDILKLAENPRPEGCKKLKDRPGYRIRTGDYRVIYEINDQQEQVDILNVGHRKDIYKM